MPTTPNFGWITPADTDYVRDGAAAIRALGDAIDVDLDGHTHDTAHKHDADYVNVTGDTMTGDLGIHTYSERRSNRNQTSMGVSFAAEQLVHNVSTGNVTVSFSAIPTGAVVRSVTLVFAGPPASITWPAGTRFPGGAPPEIDGEMWLTAVATDGAVTVFTAAAAVA